MTAPSNLTASQKDALCWLRSRNGTGVLGKHGTLLAAGEWAPHRRVTWESLEKLGCVCIDGRRVTIAEGV